MPCNDHDDGDIDLLVIDGFVSHEICGDFVSFRCFLSFLSVSAGVAIFVDLSHIYRYLFEHVARLFSVSHITFFQYFVWNSFRCTHAQITNVYESFHSFAMGMGISDMRSSTAV